MTKSEIIKIINQLKKQGLLTRAPSNEVVFERFKNSDSKDEIVKFILSSGEPKQVNECSECRQMLSESEFSYYQARVKKDGYLSRVNALCHACRKKLGKDRKEVFEQEKGKIPPKPKRGAVCPLCDRAWRGEWHKDHDYVTKEFRGWICGNCNMKAGDRRTPKRGKQ